MAVSGVSSSPRKRQSLWPVSIFTLTYLAAAVLIAVLSGNSEFLLYIVVMLVLIMAVCVVHKNVRLSNAVLWSLSVWGLAHMAGGLVVVPEQWPVDSGSLVLYSLWIVPEILKYDHVVHAYGFGVTTWVCWQGLRAAIETRGGAIAPTFGLVFIAAIAGMGLGALNELIEFVATLLLPETNVGGYINTGWDLVANLIGCVVAAALIWFHGTRDHQQ